MYWENYNKRSIEKINIFDHWGLMKDCDKAFKKNRGDFEAFSKEVRGSLQYYFWSKCEYEIILTSLFVRDRFKVEKIDIYDQVMLNWDVFINYVWNCYRKPFEKEIVKTETK